MIHEDSSFQEMVCAWRYYDADYGRSPFHHLQLTVLAVTAAAGHPPRQAAPAAEAKVVVRPCKGVVK